MHLNIHLLHKKPTTQTEDHILQTVKENYLEKIVQEYSNS